MTTHDLARYDEDGFTVEQDTPDGQPAIVQDPNHPTNIKAAAEWIVDSIEKGVPLRQSPGYGSVRRVCEYAVKQAESEAAE